MKMRRLSYNEIDELYQKLCLYNMGVSDDSSILLRFKRALFSPNEYVVLGKSIPELNELNVITGVMSIVSEEGHLQRFREYELKEHLEIVKKNIRRSL